MASYNGEHDATHGSRARWVVAELDARGEIDRHATMCLRHGIEGALASGLTWIVVDLRDLTAIDEAALAMFVQVHADCHAAGVLLSLLISDRPGQREIAVAFDAAGLADDLDVAAAPAPPPARGARRRARRRVTRPATEPL